MIETDGDNLGASHIVSGAPSGNAIRVPSLRLQRILAEAGVGLSDVDHVVFYDKPLVKFERLLMTYLAIAPRGLASFIQQMPAWLKEKIFMRNTIRQALDYQGKVLFCTHHQSHAAAAFLPSPFQEAAFITLDGVGEWATSTYGVGRDNRVEILKEIGPGLRIDDLASISKGYS